jgi:hypothetical protein
MERDHPDFFNCIDSTHGALYRQAYSQINKLKNVLMNPGHAHEIKECFLV